MARGGTQSECLLQVPQGGSEQSTNRIFFGLNRERCLEWTTEVVFQPSPASDPTLSTEQSPTTVNLQPQKSSKTLYQVISDAFNSRDKKGKGKVLDEETSKWVKTEKEWLASLAPTPVSAVPTLAPVPDSTTACEDGQSIEKKPEPSTSTLASATGSPVPPPNLNPSPIAPNPSPFLLLLSYYAAPIPFIQTSSDDPSSPPIPSLPPPTVAKPPARKYFLLEPTLSLRDVLRGTTILEYPTISLWSAERLLRARLEGTVEIVEKPVATLLERGG